MIWQLRAILKLGTFVFLDVGELKQVSRRSMHRSLTFARNAAWSWEFICRCAIARSAKASATIVNAARLLSTEAAPAGAPKPTV